jgi:hypothetical protein
MKTPTLPSHKKNKKDNNKEKINLIKLKSTDNTRNLKHEKKQKTYDIYIVKNYTQTDNNYIKNNVISFTNYKNLSEKLYEDNFYHFRIHKNTNYIFFGDIDKYKNDIIDFILILKTFLQKYYNLSFEDDDFKYTENNKIKGSYHYSITKWNLSTEKLKEIHSNLLKIYQTDFSYKSEKKMINVIDTTIYSEHWFRAPYQSKGINTKENNQHIVINGNIEDFIITHIPKKSINIDNIKYIERNQIESNKKIKKTKHNKDEQSDKIIIHTGENKHDTTVLSTCLSQIYLYKKMFDECYNQKRFDIYEYWISVGMAIKNTFSNKDDAIELFNYFSSKGENYEGYEKTLSKYSTFIKTKNSNGYTIATIHYYAIEDNKQKFIEIMNKNSFELGQTDFCKYLKIIAGYKFIYKNNEDNYTLYCYNGKFWILGDILMRNCISTELYSFLKTILIEVYWNSKDFYSLKSKIEKLKQMSLKKDIVETYKEYGINNDVQFDSKWYLLGFNNLVYDMQEEIFREYKYDDYISITTGYDWKEPTDKEIATINNLIKLIMPIKEERDSFLQILCTGIDGRCLEKFIVFNGRGGNGKGLINDLMLLALGNYAMIGNNGILFECSKTGGNPEKANLHKKRYVVFREPPEKKKFENSIIKELTGGGGFSARNNYENKCEKELNLTMVVECNDRPQFTEEPKDAEIRRIIDLFFRSSFIDDESMVDEKNNIYLKNINYKTKEFQQQHKFALIKILLLEHSKFYKKNNSTLKISQSIKDRTQSYLELSCNIVQWFKNNYHKSKENDICQIKEIFINFIGSDYYFNLSKADKNKYNKTYFMKYMRENIFFRNYYSERFSGVRNVIKGWKINKEQNNDNE